MAFLNITEYQHVERGPEGPQSLPFEDSNVVRQNLTMTGASAQSDPFASTTRFVKLCSDAACYWSPGTDPDATTHYSYLPAGVIDWVAVPVGQSWKIAART